MNQEVIQAAVDALRVCFLRMNLRVCDILDDVEIERLARVAIAAADAEHVRQNRAGYTPGTFLDRLTADFKAGRYDDCFAEEKK